MEAWSRKRLTTCITYIITSVIAPPQRGGTSATIRAAEGADGSQARKSVGALLGDDSGWSGPAIASILCMSPTGGSGSVLSGRVGGGVAFVIGRRGDILRLESSDGRGVMGGAGQA